MTKSSRYSSLPAYLNTCRAAGKATVHVVVAGKYPDHVTRDELTAERMILIERREQQLIL
jgi:uncharacterized protein (AIM24 family)